MKLMLTSGGVTNPSIEAALVRLLGKPIDQCRALCIPTAQWGHPMCGPTSVQGFVAAGPSWRQSSGLADLVPSLRDTVWVGVSAGSMVMTPRIGPYFVEWASAPDDRALDVVDFSIFPHLDAFSTNTLAHAEQWAADIGVPAYAIDEQTAITVVEGRVEVVSEGQWTKLR